MRYIIYSVIICCCFAGTASAQKKWNLRDCVEYAMANNLSVKQVDLQTRFAEIQARQSRYSIFPNASLSLGPSFNNGRNQDPTSFNLITQSYVSTNVQLQTSVDIFNWFSKRNTIAANEWELLAAKANTDKAKNDIALTVANAYLQVLLAIEQQNIAEVQVQQSIAQLGNTRKMVDAGTLPELNAAEVEAQVARDSATYLTAKGAVEQNLLLLKSYMSIDAATPFEIDTPPADKIPVDPIGELQPDAVYALALANMPQQKFNDFKLKAAQKNSAAARGLLYPTFSIWGSLGSGFNSRAQEIVSSSKINAPIGSVSVNGTDYTVFPNQPFTNYEYGKIGFFPQFNQNFRQAIGLTMSVPIFNGYAARSNYQRSKVTIQNQELQKQVDDQKLKQDIYQAYNAAIIALEKYSASKKSWETSERTYNFAKKRYDVGMLGTFELITNQNNLFRAKLEYALNQFDYVFKMKVLEFYKGQGLKL
jgi:outer membrane protein